jgi:hypothetical protein
MISPRCRPRPPPRAPFRGGVLETTEVGEHAGRDTDAGRGERGADEDRHERRGTQRVHDAVTDGERHCDAYQGDQRCLSTGPQQVNKIGLQTDLEEQDQDAEFGQRVKNLRLGDETQNAGADDYSGEQFTQDGGLTDTLHHLARQLCGEPDEDQAH